MGRLLTMVAGFMAACAAWADSTYAPTDAEASKYSVEQAAGYVQRGLAICNPDNPAKVVTMPDIVTVAWQSNNFLVLQFRELHDIRLGWEGSSFFKSLPYDTLSIQAQGHFFQDARDYTNLAMKCTRLAEDWTKVFADALLRLKLEYDRANSPEVLAKFSEEALRYNAMDPKPPIPEEARRLRVQAEGAVQAKRFLEAAEKYGKAIEIAPWWPEAHFNRAVVLAELQNFDSAISEMKRYLILRPDAPDARQAQDFIYAWEAHPFEKK